MKAFVTTWLLAFAIGLTAIEPAVATCGNGTVEPGLMEMCDDNNTLPGDGCDSMCRIEPGYSCSGEPSVCTMGCGDGIMMGSEACDDNNTQSGDGCSSVCLVEAGFECNDEPSNCTTTCGDGILAGTEQCDDGATSPGDGCSAFCVIEYGFTCRGTPSNCSSQCGDGLIASDEECDDENMIDGEGCSSSCLIERGYMCFSSPSVCNGTCGDRVRVVGEECDDATTITGDGCSNCIIEPNFACTEDMSGLSNCTAVLLDLNVPDNTTIDYTNEYLDLVELVYLFDPNNTNFSSFFVSPLGQNWTSIYVVILNGVDPIDNQADAHPQEAFAAGRLPAGLTPRDVPLIRRLLFTDDPRLEGFGLNISDVVTGMQISRDGGHGTLGRREIEFVLKSLGFAANEHPGYGPREVCIVAQDIMYHTTACVTLFFIGRNDDPPTITYLPNFNVQFVEGQTDFVPIVNGTLTVSDPDHPTRYLMMSAEAAIDGFIPNSLEELSVTHQLTGFSYNYNWDTGVLTISGNGTTELYSQIFSSLTYHNDMAEPLDSVRTIEVSVFDGVRRSLAADIIVEIVNINDPPVVSLDGAEPVVTERTVNYRERDGETPVVSALTVIDTDPGAMIQRATVTLANPVDSTFESIEITANVSLIPLSLERTQHRLKITGLATQEVYTNVLRTLTYFHSDANPGNPTQFPSRLLQFDVEDETNTSSVSSSVLTINIQPINDAPILSIVSDPAVRSGALLQNGATEAVFMYLEDDPALSIGADIYLRDVDSNISSVNIYASGLVDGKQDRLSFSDLYGIYISEAELGGGNRTITLTGDFSPMLYERVLRSLSYQNTYTNNSVTDGRRTVTIVTTDSSDVSSGYIRIDIDIMDRNDGPEVNVGQGVNMDHIIRFTENGDSVPITQTFLTSLGDEEGHNISRMTVELTALNGQLDEEEFIFFRTPGGIDFLQHLEMPLTERFISISVNSSVEVYEQALTSIFYINDKDEPTLYNSTNGTDRLERVIIVTITDTNYIDPTTDPALIGDADIGVSTTVIRIGIEIIPINDNRPRIVIRSNPDSCTTDSDDYTEGGGRRRRDIRSVSRVMKKSVMLNAKREQQSYSMSPKILSASPKFLETNNPTMKCLKRVTLTFNTNTSTPLVEIPSRIDDLISFDPPKLNSADKFGVWLDYRTLVVNFLGECMEVEVETTSGRPRPMFVVFEAEQGDCDWNSFCRTGVCFQNRTGCPMISYTPIVHPAEPTVDLSATTESPMQPSAYALVFVVTIASFLILSCLLVVVSGIITFRNRPSTSKTQTSTESNSRKYVEDLIVVTLKNPPKATPHVPPSKRPIESSEESKDSTKTLQMAEETAQLQSPETPPETTSTKMPSSPNKKVRKVLPQAKQKPPLKEVFQETKDPPEIIERLRDVSCDQSHDHLTSEAPTEVGSSTSPQNKSREHSLGNKNTHSERTTSSNLTQKVNKSAL